ncbi:MAG: hypothetical protein P8L77_01450 [Gammaproteobacteria bacterium]|nr:hypothetical protein [Gammaproteobacteria bacterium]
MSDATANILKTNNEKITGVEIRYDIKFEAYIYMFETSALTCIPLWLNVLTNEFVIAFDCVASGLMVE